MFRSVLIIMPSIQRSESQKTSQAVKTESTYSGTRKNCKHGPKRLETSESALNGIQQFK